MSLAQLKLRFTSSSLSYQANSLVDTGRVLPGVFLVNPTYVNHFSN